jgi:hypothetical protein
MVYVYDAITGSRVSAKLPQTLVYSRKTGISKATALLTASQPPPALYSLLCTLRRDILNR